MIVCFDTEFTDLLNPALISIGFVSESRRTLYIELQDWTRDECSDFVREAVLPLLDTRPGLSVAEAASAVAAWLNSFGTSVRLICDSPIDHQLLGELLQAEGVPRPPVMDDTRVFAPSVEGERVREKLYATGLRRHHALDDARALLASWEATGG